MELTAQSRDPQVLKVLRREFEEALDEVKHKFRAVYLWWCRTAFSQAETEQVLLLLFRKRECDLL
jgi:hypothetical protein